MITENDLTNWFSYHIPDKTDLMKYQTIRESALVLAGVILEHTSPGADQNAAIRKVREAVMTANAAIACGGK